MKTTVVSDVEFTKIVGRDESHFFDVKSYAVSGKSLQKIGVAFSNADGGELIVGIADNRGDIHLDERWEGISSIEGLNGHLQALFEVKPSLDIQYEFIKREAKNGYALRIMIEKGTQVCSTADGSIYLRQGAQSLLIKDPDRIQQLHFAKGARSFEDTLLADLPPEEVVDARELASFLTDYSPKTDPLEFALIKIYWITRRGSLVPSEPCCFTPLPALWFRGSVLSRLLDMKLERMIPRGIISPNR